MISTKARVRGLPLGAARCCRAPAPREEHLKDCIIDAFYKGINTSLRSPSATSSRMCCAVESALQAGQFVRCNPAIQLERPDRHRFEAGKIPASIFFELNGAPSALHSPALVDKPSAVATPAP